MKKQTLQEFIDKAIIVHGAKYDYSKVEYKGNHIKVCIICKTHGIFEQTPGNHTQGQGCIKCGFLTMGRANSITQEEFIKKSKAVHKTIYNYSEVNYRGNKVKVSILCKKHGSFEQRPNDHLSGYGCPKCSSTRITTEKFIKRANKIHCSKYSYKLTTVVLDKLAVIIGCPIHGNFEQIVSYHLQGNGCPKCSESKGEKSIRKFLTNANINFVSQYTFQSCRYKRCLPFDFAIIFNGKPIGVIEYQGIQHYNPQAFGSGKLSAEEQFLLVKLRDSIKRDYCQSHNIPLLEISYKEIATQVLIQTFLESLKDQNEILTS